MGMFLKTLIIGLIAIALGNVSFSQDSSLPNRLSETATEKAARMHWWLADRFGMFIHWGLYALPARHEWMQYNERMAYEDYRKRYLDKFNPDLYNPADWVRQAK